MSQQISLTIQARDKNLIYSATGLSDAHDLAIIQGMFAAFGGCDGGPLQVKYEAQPAPQPKAVEHPKAVEQPKQEPVQERPRRLPIVVNNNHSTFQIGELPAADKLIEASMKIASETGLDIPDHLKTGIKIKEIGGEMKRTYRCRNNCPKCGQTSNSYLLPNNVWSRCFHCGTKLAAIPATPDQLLVPDEQMNFFYAEEEYYEVGHDDDEQGS